MRFRGSMVAAAAALIFVTCTAEKCDGSVDTSDTKMRQQQEQMANQGVQAVGMPAIVNFAEKRLLKDIYELRDQMLPTHAYVKDMSGHFHKFCDSLGYGMPAATQFTNPMKPIMGYHEYTTIPQADPNGLFSPSSAEGTYIFCLNPETKKPAVLYSEERLTVSPFKLPNAVE